MGVNVGKTLTRVTTAVVVQANEIAQENLSRRYLGIYDPGLMSSVHLHTKGYPSQDASVRVSEQIGLEPIVSLSGGLDRNLSQLHTASGLWDLRPPGS